MIMLNMINFLVAMMLLFVTLHLGYPWAQDFVETYLEENLPIQEESSKADVQDFAISLKLHYNTIMKTSSRSSEAVHKG